MALTKITTDLNIIQSLDDQPNAVTGLTAAQVKAKWDEGSNTIKTFVNNTLTAEQDAINTNLQNQITSNDTDISALGTRITTNEGNIASVQTNKSDKTEVLTKTNTTSFTPTANYHPSTKKYVDDSVAGVVLGQIPDNSLTETKMANDMKKDIVGGVASYDNFVSQMADIATDVTNLQNNKANKTEIVSQTTANITYYVSTTGNDSNDGLTSGTAFKTIQYAVNKIPQIINHAVVINVASGTYAENIELSGYYGKGSINLKGGTSLATAVNFTVNNITIKSCTLPTLNIIGFTASTTGTAFQIISSNNPTLQYCRVVSSGGNGVIVTASIANITICEISNKSTAINASQSIVLSGNHNGSGNTTVLYSSFGATIVKTGTQPTGTTAEVIYAGGEIK